MSTPQDRTSEEIAAADAIVEKKRRFSIVWVVPLVAVAIGAWLVYKAKTEQGPLVSITFNKAEGAVAAKTKVKFRDVEVGLVETLELNTDLTEVKLGVRLAKELEPHLTEATSFWVVRPEVNAAQITGLETLLSGVYIGIDPGRDGTTRKRVFRGQEQAPPIAITRAGRYFVLESDSLGSLKVGSPIYYRRLKAGQVTSVDLSKGATHVAIRVFIDAPFDQIINDRTLFWHASGMSASIDAKGIKVKAGSLWAILAGGLEFDTPPTDAGRAVQDEHLFPLYESREDATAPVFEAKEKLLLYFEGTVRGLSVGAPVEIRGTQVGKVVDIQLVADAATLALTASVLIEFEYGHFKLVNQTDPSSVVQLPPRSEEEKTALFDQLIELGLRAQLKTGSLLTGQLFVDLDFHPNGPSAQLSRQDGMFVLPTITTDLDQARQDIQSLVQRLEALPVEQLVAELLETVRGASELTNSQELRDSLALLKDTMSGASELTNSSELRQSLVLLRQTLANSDKLTSELGSELLPELQATLEEGVTTLRLVQTGYLREDSAVYHQLTRMLGELNAAARSIRLMTEYLERHPDSLIKGKTR
jgi:paraquat-inducible protein B